MKYAPAQGGLKPWVVTISEWGHTRERIVYALTRRDAEYKLIGRIRHVSAHGRRATVEDVERLSGSTATQEDENAA